MMSKRFWHCYCFHFSQIRLNRGYRQNQNHFCPSYGRMTQMRFHLKLSMKNRFQAFQMIPIIQNQCLHNCHQVQLSVDHSLQLCKFFKVPLLLWPKAISLETLIFKVSKIKLDYWPYPQPRSISTKDSQTSYFLCFGTLTIAHFQASSLYWFLVSIKEPTRSWVPYFIVYPSPHIDFRMVIYWVACFCQKN